MKIRQQISAFEEFKWVFVGVFMKYSCDYYKWMIYDQLTEVWLRENIKIVLSRMRKRFACQNKNINLPSPCLKGKITIGCISRWTKICQVHYSYFLDLRSILDIQKLIIFNQNDKYQIAGWYENQRLNANNDTACHIKGQCMSIFDRF